MIYVKSAYLVLLFNIKIIHLILLIMRTGIIIMLVFLLTSQASNAQECVMYFPDKIGSVREMKFYDQRDRLSSITRQEILDKIISGAATQVKVRTTSYDKDESEIYTGELEFICENGIFRFDLKDYLDPATLASYQDMGVDITADNLSYPSNLQNGDKLPDGDIKMVVKSGATTLITISVNISNRTVAGKEAIVTEGGTYNCHKITYDITSKAGFITTSSSAVEWIADGVGLVRRGRLAGYSVLTSLSN
jgi:hypothetical protein